MDRITYQARKAGRYWIGGVQRDGIDRAPVMRCGVKCRHATEEAALDCAKRTVTTIEAAGVKVRAIRW